MQLKGIKKTSQKWIIDMLKNLNILRNNKSRKVTCSMVKFLDTCALLELQDKIFESDDKIIISSISIKELEQIKTSAYKDGEIKWAARHLLKLLSENEDKYEIEMYKNHYEEEMRMLDLRRGESRSLQRQKAPQGPRDLRTRRRQRRGR